MDLETLRQHLDEDERVALAAGGDSPNWHQPDPEREHGRIEDDAADVVTYDESAPSEAQAAHISRHDPARVLRWVKAARQILERHTRSSPTSCYHCARGRYEDCPDVAAVASVYGDTDG